MIRTWLIPSRPESIVAGIRFRLMVCDITGDDTQRELSRIGPYDLALFIGLSSWLPKPQAVRHLRWLASNLDADGVLVSDCFTAAAYSLGGSCIGYRAQYYSPAQYRCLVDYCASYRAGRRPTHN